MRENPERVHEREQNGQMFKKWTKCRGGQTGTASELTICVDLLRKGWDVFRAVSPACPWDLIVSKGPVLMRVEVRTSAKMRGKLSAGTHGNYDILAIVRGQEIAYRPELPIIDEL